LFRIGCWLVLAFATVVSGGEPPIHWFHLDYFVVDDTLKGDQGLSMELLEIAKYDSSIG